METEERVEEELETEAGSRGRRWTGVAEGARGRPVEGENLASDHAGTSDIVSLKNPNNGD
jgi:hypothetical protein